MKKQLAILMAALLLCSLAACAGETEQPTETPDASTSETEQPPASTVDYTAFCGDYSDSETIEGPCYTVSISNADNEAKAIELAVYYVGPNASPIYATETIRASIADDHTVQFEWMDSWGNQGIGTLVLNPDDTSMVELMMTVTEEADTNRATLSTHDQYKTLLRR